MNTFFAVKTYVNAAQAWCRKGSSSTRHNKSRTLNDWWLVVGALAVRSGQVEERFQNALLQSEQTNQLHRFLCVHYW
jgi:hypothetical protein